MIDVLKRRLINNKNLFWSVIKRTSNYKICSLKETSQFIGNSVINGGTGNEIVIGENAKVSFCKFVIRGSNNKIIIDDDVDMNGAIIYFDKDNNYVHIGEGTTFTGKTEFFLADSTHITIGTDCMFAFDIVLRTSDFHPIFDKDNIRINQSDNIEIGNHVWVGQGVFLLKGSRIPDGTIIGACALITKAFTQSNTVVAGSPARVIRDFAQWER